jgi:hypothetical protein
VPTLLSTIALLAAFLVAPAAHADDNNNNNGNESPTIEDYASYQAQTTCHPKPRRGTVLLGEYLVATYGGGGGATGRACGGSPSEHKDGRAIDWTLDATSKADRQIAKAFLKDAFATDADGNAHALARRMGIMYVIWNDHMYSAWDAFAIDGYLSSSCKSVKKCSKTLRHRDHMHISLSVDGAKAKTSWYDGRL